MPDEKREILLAYDQLVCSCGNLRSECSDPTIDWHPRTTVCYVSATTAWAQRKLQDKHKSKKFEADSLHPLEGVGVWVSPVPPPKGEDEFA